MLNQKTFSENKMSNHMDEIQQRKQLLLISSINLVSCVFLIIFGCHSIIKELYTLAFILFLTFVIIVTNQIFFLYSKNYSIASMILGISIVIFCLYLIISGGYQNTGPIWTFPLIAVATFINFWKTALWQVSFFFFGCLVFVIGGEIGLYETIYSTDIVIRFLTSLFALSIACLVLGYTQERAHETVDEMNKKLEFTAHTDSLTGLFNRHFVSENYIKNNYFVPKVCEQSALLLIDIDHFKQVNDKHGHVEGDKILRVISDSLILAVRDKDVITRWGGEEFLIILKGAPLTVAYRRAERFRKIIEDLNVTINNEKLHLTVSIGVSLIDNCHSAAEIINKADEKLYQAKHQGRNQVC